MVNFGPFLLLLTGALELYSSLNQSPGRNNWVLREATTQIIFIALVDLMICIVFWLIANDFEKTQKKLNSSNIIITDGTSLE